jgi:hypothetical protein
MWLIAFHDSLEPFRAAGGTIVFLGGPERMTVADLEALRQAFPELAVRRHGTDSGRADP